MGIDGLSSAEASRLKVGNASFHVACRVIGLCASPGIPVFLENPLTSLMWQAPRFVALSRLTSFSSSVCHMGQYGTPWKKPTRICAWHGGSGYHICQKCRPCGRVCSRSQRPHLVLSGKAPGGVHYTALAASYPP
eukprot:4418838-Pyramimonas_sp.AAC.1